MATKSKKQAIDKFELVSNKIAELLEQGVKPWEKPWVGAAAPCNLITGHRYRGYNPLLCSIDMLLNEWEHPYFLTLKQGQALGWKLAKGSKSTWIKFGGAVSKTEKDANGQDQTVWFTMFKWFNVFNVALFSDEDSDIKIQDYINKIRPEPLKTEAERIEAAEQFCSRMPVEVSFGGDSAFYSATLDKIKCPEMKRFTSSEAFYATQIHEHAHSTGHHSRLNRNLGGTFGSESYAYEELIAELTAAFVCNELGIESTLENHASYLHSWMKKFKSDPKYFFKAAKDANKAATWLLTQAGLIEVALEEEEVAA